ncbi:MAG: 5'-3' exonuclease H3TH domain-containing protein [Polyangiales bacterium]
MSTPSTPPRTVLVLDTFSLFFRSFHALPPMTTLAGEPTWAIYGFSALLLKLLREEKPVGVALALDRPEPTFRHEAYSEYKATRPPAPSDFVRQLRGLDQLIDALGFPRFSVRGYEADDVLATLASELAAQGEHVLVASGDRDLLQLARDHVDVLFLGQRGKPPTRYDAAAVEARFGVPAASLPAYVAMIGDVSDNVPKVKGLGPVAASKLVAAHGTIAALLAHADAIESARLRELVVAHGDQLRASEDLVRLRDDVPLPEGPRHAGLTHEAIARTTELFEALEFKSLIPRLTALAPK